MVYKTGGDYSLEYVRRLASSGARHGVKDIVCLSDDPAVSRYCEHIQLVHGWPGWWSKLELFKHLKSALYVDLDTIINGSLSAMLSHPHRFTMLKDFNGSGKGASGVMAWNGDYRYLADLFTPDRIPEYSQGGIKWGDQDWINDHLSHRPEFLQDLFPGAIVSRKWERNRRARVRASLVCYHGKPRPHECRWRI